MAAILTRAQADAQILALQNSTGIDAVTMAYLIALVEAKVPDPNLALLPSFSAGMPALADDLDLTRYIARVTATPANHIVHPVIALAINSPTTVFRADSGVSKSMAEWVGVHTAARPEIMAFVMSRTPYAPDLATPQGRASHNALAHEAQFIVSKVVQKILAAECHAMRPHYTRPLPAQTPTHDDVLKWLNACMCRELLFPSDVAKLEKLNVVVCTLPRVNVRPRPI